MPRLLITDPEARAQLILVEHQRRDIKGCTCGQWGSDHGHMGRSHTGHVIEQLHAAGLRIVSA